eukprot:CAMPEP_0119063636 /NCGR_PEP_ID=MMETSP1178-20130426/6925_1 /TAXON_ID=33656 /ORGANISM="unid sp, Strain CCMP2000" /LENGTH=136 /DNA_ID=CAMNT_0007045009 /DNA_START=61 /DNA_END=468 /DNA_ORIENTATION=+
MTSRPIAALLAKRTAERSATAEWSPHSLPDHTELANEHDACAEGLLPARSQGDHARKQEEAEFGLGAFAGLRQSSSSDEGGRPERHTRIDLHQFDSVDDLLSVGADALKAELARLGLKCGGTPLQRAERLWQTKGV